MANRKMTIWGALWRSTNIYVGSFVVTFALCVPVMLIARGGMVVSLILSCIMGTVAFILHMLWLVDNGEI